MKKLKRLAVQNFSRLSREEMAAVEGRDGSWVDVCSSDTYGQLCLIETLYVGGHMAVVLGTCALRTMPMQGTLVSYYACV